MTETEKKPLVVVGFSSPLAASRAYAWLQKRGYGEAEVSVLLSEDRVDEFWGELAKQGGGKNTMTGMAIGAAVGATAATITALAVPGLNLVAFGGLLAALGGASAGTVTGGLIGGMVDLTLPEQSVNAAQAIIRKGGVVLVVNSRDGDEEAIRERFAEAESIVVGAAP